MRVYCPVLVGGPHNFGVLTIDAADPPSELRFPTEPAPPFRGVRSICAPRPTDDGPERYALVGMNAMGNPVYEYRQLTESAA